MSRIQLLLLAAALTAACGAAFSAVKSIAAVRVTVPPVIDGVLADPAWRSALPVHDFTQFDPAEGAAPTESTVVRVLYDNNAVYVGVQCLDSDPKAVIGQLTRRDRSTEADRFTVMIDSYHDHQTAFVFSTNVSGVQSDGVLSQDGTVYDISWDAVWRVAAVRTTRGWSAEFAIPFNALRFASSADSVYQWGINFRRYISRKKETDEWVMVPRSERLMISQWGHLVGLNNIRPPLHLEVMPYISEGGDFHSSGMYGGKRSDLLQSAGVDIKYGLSRNFTLDATVHPDFGQVEVDQAVLNLTVFEPFFPEKRPFFVEGSTMFAFGTSIDNTSMPLFFSRRIGRMPHGSPYVAAPPGGTISENPQVTTILGAAKVTGRSSSGLSAGILAAATGREEAFVRDAAGAVSSFETEPRALYGVARVRQDLGGTSWIGLMGTAAGRQGEIPGFTAGADWNLRFGEGTMTWDGYLAGARASDETGSDGTAGRFLLSRISAEHWLYVGSFDFASRSFDPNDLGYFARPHDMGGYGQILYRENFASAPFLRYSFSVVPEARWNWDRVRTFAQVEGVFAADFTNFWHSQVFYRMLLPSFEDEERGIIGLRLRPAGHAFELQVRSDDRRDVWASVDGVYEVDRHGKRSLSTSLAMTLRPSSWMELSPFLVYQSTRSELAWVFGSLPVTDPAVSPSPFSVFGDRDVDELDAGVRGIVTFTRTLSLQGFVQVLLARGRYGSYTRLDNSGWTIPYAFELSQGYASYNFNEATLNANLLLRWEYVPGSTFYLAWTQERYGDSGEYGTTFGTRFRDTFTLPQENVVLAKVTYWFSL